MSFSGDAKRELCRDGLQRSCCARAEAYGVLLYCNTFTPQEIRIITENEEFAQRLPRLFQRAFHVAFDRLPEGESGRGKRILQMTDREKLSRIIDALGYDPRQNLVLHINFGLLEEGLLPRRLPPGGLPGRGQRHRSRQALPTWSWPPPTPRPAGSWTPCCGIWATTPRA